MEARFQARVRAVWCGARTGRRVRACSNARWDAPLRHGLELGRFRKPDRADVAGAVAHRDRLECRRTLAATAYRTRGSAGPDRGPRRRARAPATLIRYAGTTGAGSSVSLSRSGVAEQTRRGLRAPGAGD